MVERVEPAELYQVRKEMLEARCKSLNAQLADLKVQEQLLEMESKYKLLATDSTLDVGTGVITRVSEVDNASDSENPEAVV